MALIKIPKTPASAYNPGRKASDLLLFHVWNLEKALGRRPKPVASRKSMTEGEAAAYIRQLGRELHHRVLLPDVGAAPTVLQRPAVSSGAKPAGRKKPATRTTGRRTRKGGRR
jgi:hypothetical protein